MKPYYITTSIPYPNANLHIGHAVEMIQADVIARYARLMHYDVRFQTGIDEHGLKVQQSAEKAGIEPEAFVEDKTTSFKNLLDALDISYTRFIRTSDPDHIQMSQAMWNACVAAGDIYKDRYEAWYSVKEEEHLGLVSQFPDPSVFGVDAKFIEKVAEDNYFFRLSRYTQDIVELLKSGTLKVTPAFRAQELINFIESKGLEDVSISRDISKLHWGVPVPNDDSQVMYVWFDALTNYLTGAASIDDRGIIQPGEFWPPALHCVGKDISRFHCVLWPAMLLSAKLPLPREVLVHGFLNVDGQKISKSLGNAVDPMEVLQTYSADALRWYCIRHVPTTADADYTAERFTQVFEADLANDYGNLISRVWTMVQKYMEGKVPLGEGVSEPAFMKDKWRAYHQAFADLKMDEAAAVAHSLIVLANQKIEEKKPWVLAKQGQLTELNSVLYELLELIRQATLMMSPILPVSTERVAHDFFADSVSQNLWKELDSAWGSLKPGVALGTTQVILFPKEHL